MVAQDLPDLLKNAIGLAKDKPGIMLHNDSVSYLISSSGIEMYRKNHQGNQSITKFTQASPSSFLQWFETQPGQIQQEIIERLSNYVSNPPETPKPQEHFSVSDYLD